MTFLRSFSSGRFQMHINNKDIAPRRSRYFFFIALCTEEKTRTDGNAVYRLTSEPINQLTNH